MTISKSKGLVGKSRNERWVVWFRFFQLTERLKIVIILNSIVKCWNIQLNFFYYFCQGVHSLCCRPETVYSVLCTTYQNTFVYLTSYSDGWVCGGQVGEDQPDGNCPGAQRGGYSLHAVHKVQDKVKIQL